MLDELSTQEAKHEQKEGDKNRVLCFVCKREVERTLVRQVDHPKMKKVWVCEQHIK